MKNFVDRMFSRLIAEDTGAEIAEAAAVLPLMFMILLGIFWFGQAFSIYGAINRAAHEGARAGSVPSCVTCTGTNNIAQYELNAVNAVNTALTQSQLDPLKAQSPAVQPPFVPCTSGTTSCSAGNVCVQIPVQISDPTTAPGACGISVSFRYPYQFWLPFSSLNNQIIYLNASAQVRMESP